MDLKFKRLDLTNDALSLAPQRSGPNINEYSAWASTFSGVNLSESISTFERNNLM